ncbi:hypothetical protein [Streptomyces sp. rh34]|uniref:hypothetical protein n=1 Tax=Streptomyces sp. rh34 TaxID=2034272 RepID=UPI0015CF3D83|nr:hypothetical protein [Streptomyces sp. rh34]
MSHNSLRQQRLGVAEAAVIIAIVVTTGILIGAFPDRPPMPPDRVLAVIAAAALIGSITVRLAVVGIIGPVRAVAARTLALASVPAQGSARVEE